MEFGINAHLSFVSENCFLNYLTNNFIFFLDVGYTNNGEECRNKCGVNGTSSYWCLTVGEEGYWDTCTPNGIDNFLLNTKYFCMYLYIFYRSL